MIAFCHVSYNQTTSYRSSNNLDHIGENRWEIMLMYSKIKGKCETENRVAIIIQQKNRINNKIHEKIK